MDLIVRVILYSYGWLWAFHHAEKVWFNIHHQSLRNGNIHGVVFTIVRSVTRITLSSEGVIFQLSLNTLLLISVVCVC